MVELLDTLYSNKTLLIILTLLVGIALGLFAIRPLLSALRRRAMRERRNYLAILLNSFKRASLVLGVLGVLNMLLILPVDLPWNKGYRLTVSVLNTLALTFITAELLIFIYEKYTARRIDSKVSTLFHIIIRLLVYSAGILMVSSIVDYDIKAMLTALGVGGLAIALALQDTLSNLFAGLQILASKQLKPGDYVRVDDQVEGYVIDINWRNTTLRTLQENVIIVSNTQLSQSITINFFTLQKNLYFKIAVGVHYDSDLDHVERVTLEVAEQVLEQFPDVPRDFHPKVRFNEFADSSINFHVWMATDLYENRMIIQHHFIKALHKRYNQEGISIPYPIRSVYIEKSE
ncbi:MAG: mechanosensitive ion channel protein MscS [Bacteroidia bacterium]|nr:MAG: mechanosensitive ion channel protein MscS [Bacteroidia bacterium]